MTTSVRRRRRTGRRPAHRTHRHHAIGWLAFAALLSGQVVAQAIVGSYQAIDADVTLEFRTLEGAPGYVHGTYRDPNVDVTLTGVADEDGAYGSVDGTDLGFEAYVAGDRLVLYVYEFDAYGGADMATVEELTFVRVGVEAPADAAPTRPTRPPPAPTTPAGGADGVDVVAGQEYPAGTQVRIGGLGLSLLVPEGWLGGMQVGRAVMLFGSHTLPGMVLVLPFVGSGIDDVLAGMAQPIDLGDGAVLQAVAPERSGATARADMTGFGPQGPIHGHAIATVGEASGALIMAVDAAASGRDQSFYRDVADRFAQGVRLGAPTAAEHDASWFARLAGSMLRFQSSGGGGDIGVVQSSATAHLCSDGSFHYAGRSAVSATVPGVTALGTDATELSGRWHVSALGPEQALLIGHDGTGASHLWVLNAVENEFYVNGERWSLGPSDACR